MINQGNLNLSLNIKEIEQIEIITPIIKDFKFNNIFVSPLKRAKKSAQIHFKEAKNKLTFDHLIEERNYDVESQEVFEMKVNSFLDQYINGYHDNNMILVSHGGVFEILHTRLLGKEVPIFQIERGKVVIFTYNKSFKKWILHEI